MTTQTGAGWLTTHVLDTALGRPAEGVSLAVVDVATGSLLAEAVTNADGRCDQPLLQGERFRIGRYELRFTLAPYFARHHRDLADPSFLDVISLRFGVADSSVHYHVPLLVSPFGYCTYRGS